MADHTVTNPYITIVAKKSRNLHKKLDKILKADTQQASGKALNDEQLILLTTRSSVEKQLADVDSIKALMEEVAAAEVEERGRERPEPCRDEVNTVDAPSVAAAEQVTAAHASEIEELKRQLADETSARVTAERALEELAVAYQTQEAAAAAAATAAAAPVAALTPDYQATLQLKINKMLKLFHVCARYPGAKLPPDVNYFGKCLMGETSISGFKETLQESTRKAELYLDDELCAQFEASRGMTYRDISILMDDLATELGGPVTPPPEPTSPLINFFTDTEVDLAPLSLMVPLSAPTSLQDQQQQVIEEHIDALILEEKASLVASAGAGADGDSASAAGSKKPQKPRGKKPRSKREPRAEGDTAAPHSAAPAPAPAKPASASAWGGGVSSAHKAATTSATAAAGNSSSATNKAPRSSSTNSGSGRGSGSGSGGKGSKAGGAGRGVAKSAAAGAKPASASK